ncbi:DNA-binding protein [Leucobacter aridicollis]|uniref:Rv2175c family DNA-binding protein n=1 Tax=Leucobacter aridicollis TaxID=283878 RepID=UPI000EB2CEB6|nr:Rv2175c family DNA-binding protein [Leucobacter aridicollis]MCS3428600.1 excisionase family DNA binding protein [Leucobacter aridicollis]RKQ84093.1 excisionase family DNA binding protein [Mycolicibacterium mucogenicum 261Sha1.1M5]
MSENTASIGSTLTIPEVAERFGIPLGKVHRLVEEHYLAIVRIDGIKRIPVEFLAGDEPLHSLRGTLLALSDAGLNEEESVNWLFAMNDELGVRPIDSLLIGHKSAVRRATQSLAF